MKGSRHPLGQALHRLMTFVSAGRKCCNKGSGTINIYEDAIRFTSDVDVSMANENNDPKNVSPKAIHLAPLDWRLLLGAVLTTLHNILEEFMECLRADASWKYGV